MSGYIRLSKILAKSNGNIFFDCPACEAPHGINCGDGHGPVWSWDGNIDKPTFNPSVLVTYDNGINHDPHVCHSFVRNGKIEFLGDCTHALAGKTVDIPEWEIECDGDQQ